MELWDNGLSVIDSRNEGNRFASECIFLIMYSESEKNPEAYATTIKYYQERE